MPDWCGKGTLLGLVLVTALVTYLLRVVPLVLLRRPLRNPHFVALLEYMPYALLSAMIFPDIFYATDPAAAFPGRPPVPALAGAVTAIVLAFFRLNLPIIHGMLYAVLYGDLLMTLIKFVGAFVILVNINAPLTGIVFCVLPVLTFYALRADRALERDTLAAKQELAAMNECLEDALSGIRTVKAFGNEKQEAEYFSRKSRSYTDSRCRFYRTEAFFYEVVGGYPQFLTMLTVFFGALFVGNGTLDIPVLITFLLYVGSLAEPVRILLNFMKLYEEGKAGFIRFMDMLEQEPEIREAARLANADGFIEKLAHGYDTLVGTHGITLSGGQRQRISLARVFLKNPSILILDEATSALDYESETAVQAALARLMKNRTSVIIAHRLSTIQKVDQIVVLADGGVCEKGTHEELLKKGGEYSRLYALGQ